LNIIGNWGSTTPALRHIAWTIEESREGRFRKYINNQAPVPNTFLFDCEDANRALFLAFTQHWQYKRTHGLLAFVSDYQGEMYSDLMCLQATEDDSLDRPSGHLAPVYLFLSIFLKCLLIPKFKVTERYFCIWKHAIRL
jgi:hypothetical protein